MKIAIGADKYGFQLKESIKDFLQKKGIEVHDFGTNQADEEEPYYKIATKVAGKVSTGEMPRAILVCGTGIGMSIIANKHPGVYAAVCENPIAAERSRSINDSNVLTLGGVVTTPEAAHEIVETWLTTEFKQGWDQQIAEWLDQSKNDIGRIEDQHFKK
jgi:ribose 5-phosphate isomerase B